MKDYEFRRITFYGLQEVYQFEDEHKNFDIIFDESTIIEDAVTYLVDGTSYLRFPGAPRAVAIAVADIISNHFNEDFFEVLNDKNLMHNNDPYFKTYAEDKLIYDKILSLIPRDRINWESERMQITKRLIMEEYMLDEKGLLILPRK